MNEVKCPCCDETILGVFKMEKELYCDNCCAFISYEEEKKENKNDSV